MLFLQLLCIAATVSITIALQYHANPTSEMSTDDKSINGNKTADAESDESGHELELDNEEMKDKKYLNDALRTVLDPSTTVVKRGDVVEVFKSQLNKLDKENHTFDMFMEKMDNLSLEVCKTSQEALWSYVTDINNEVKKNNMVRIAAEEDEIKKQYWNILKSKYLNDQQYTNGTKLQRKLRIIKERGTNVQMPQSKQREEIDSMQRIWSRITVCTYNKGGCNAEDSVSTMSDIISIFKTSNDTKELAYYWKAYRDATGKKIRPIFKDYVIRMNQVAESENFTDAGDMWRYAFEDDNFVETVDRIWRETKPFYDMLHSYVRAKLKASYKNDLKNNEHCIPAHLLGNLWAQEWQAIYPKVAPYPKHVRATLLDNETIHSKDLFDAVDSFHQSLGFESGKDSYEEIKDAMTTANCLPSSHDMCDGVHYKIKWCGEKVTDVVVGLSRAARLLGHVQYFKHYRNLPPLYRDGTNPAFHDAISDIVALQLTSPEYLKTLNFVNSETGHEVNINHLLWVALEKFPLMAYAYVLDKWRWDVFADSNLVNWNQHWWHLRNTMAITDVFYQKGYDWQAAHVMVSGYHCPWTPATPGGIRVLCRPCTSRINETGVSPPVDRNESDLDPAAKYHVVSHVQYITYLVSHVLEFQILLALCKKSNHTGPLHECSIHGVKEAGKLLSDGMALGASQDWRTVLQTMTGETVLRTDGIIEYFSVLAEFLKQENIKLTQIQDDMDETTPITVGIVVVTLTVLIIALYCMKKYNIANKMLSICGIRKNGSLDIATRESSRDKTNEIEGICEDKV